MVNSTGVADDATNQLAEITATLNSPAVGATTFVATFNAPVNPASVTAADFSVTAPKTITGVVVAGNGLSAKVTVSAALAATNVVGINAQSVVGADGGNGPASAATFTVVAP